MEGPEANRKAKRKEVSYEIKARLPGQTDYITIAVKDISATGARVIVPRLIKTGDEWDVLMFVSGRQIQCRAKVVWVLTLRPAMGYIPTFDVGIQFSALSEGDRQLLEQLITQ